MNTLDTTEFRKRLIHAATNGRETDYQKALKPIDSLSVFYFTIGTIFTTLTFLPIITTFILDGSLIVSIHLFVLLLIGISFYALTYIIGKSEKKKKKKRNDLMDFIYTLTTEEFDYLTWHRFDLKRKEYPVCFISVMLSDIERLEETQRTILDELHKLNVSED